MSRGPVSLFHAAATAEREKEEAAKREHHVEMIKRGQVNIYEVEQKLNKGADAVLEQAVAKLKAEMDANKNNAYVQGVGQQLIEYVQDNPSVSANLIDAKKSIQGSYTEMEKLAKQKKGTGTVMFTPQKGFEVIMKYFGIKEAVMVKVMPSATAPASPVEKVKPAPVIQQSTQAQSKVPSLGVSLDDLLS